MLNTPLKSHEPGAPVVGGAIPLSVPVLRGREWDYVKECLDTNWVSSVGPFVDRFEREIGQYVGVEHMVATSSGTSALHVALLVAGVRPGDEVLVSTLTFVAPANAIRYCGAFPVFMDAAADTWQMDIEKVAKFLAEECESSGDGIRNRRTGRRVRCVIPVHILGHSVDMDPLMALAHQYGLKVVEDVAEALGVRYRGRHVGGFGDAAAFSFNGNKIITTGGGGMVATRDHDRANRAKYLSTQAKDDPIEFVHGEVGFNYRLTNIQAALGVAQLEQLDSYIAIKRRIAARYDEGLCMKGITLMPRPSYNDSTFWMYTILIDEEKFGLNSRIVLKRLGDMKIQARPLWQPLHMSRSQAGSQSYRCEISSLLNRDALSLPCSVNLIDSEQDRVISAIRELSRLR